MATSGGAPQRLRAAIAAPPDNDAVWIDTSPLTPVAPSKPAFTTHAAPHVLTLVEVPWRAEATSHIKLSERARYDQAVAYARSIDESADDALLVAGDGAWLETTRFAVLGVEGDLLIAPPAGGDRLPSIGQARLLQLARANGRSIIRRPLYRSDAARLSEVLVVNSLRGPIAVGRCGQMTWPQLGSVTRTLIDTYAAFLAQPISHPDITPYTN